MVCVEDHACVERACHCWGGLCAVEHVEEVFGEGEICVWCDWVESAAVAVVGGDECWCLPEDVECFGAGGVGVVGVWLWVEHAHGADERAEDVHWLGGLWHGGDHAHEFGRRCVARAEVFGEGVELGACWEFGVPEEVNGFFEG